MSDMHSFSIDVAKEVGVNAAILLQSIKWWCQKNKANGKNEHDGLYWTYNSVKAWQELYPYLGKSAICTALKRLESDGYIRTGNYNKSAYDRTIWYAITDKGLSLFGECISDFQEMEGRKNGNRIDENDEPIPDTHQMHCSSQKSKKDRESFDSIISEFTECQELRDLLGEFVRMRKLIKKPLTNRALRINLSKLAKLAKDDAGMVEIVEQTVAHSWQGFYAPKGVKNEPMPDYSDYDFDSREDTIVRGPTW